jgi:hypothetical protein
MFYGVEWSSTSTATLSKPLCVHDGMELVYRECHDGVWGPEPQCYQVQVETLPQCPDGFIDTGNICYMFTEKSTYPPKCPFANVVNFNSYKDMVSITEPVWMPVRRDETNGLGFLLWTEASDEYKLEVATPYYVVGQIKGKDCLIYYNTTHTYAVSCDEEHVGVCAYRRLDQIANEFCVDPAGMCRQSELSPESGKCFCLGSGAQDQSQYIKAEFLQLYQNNIYQALTSDPCTIGLEKTSNGTYIWSNSHRTIDYTFWAPEATFDTDLVYGAATGGGWILTKEPYLCFIFEKQAAVPEPTLVLRYDEDSNYFHLEVANPQGLIRAGSNPLMYCFTDAGALSLIYRYDTLDKISEEEYGFEPHRYGPAHYWCEAFRFRDSQPLKTQVIFVNNKKFFTAEFVTVLKVEYVIGTNPLSQSIIEFLQRIFFIKLDLTEQPYQYTSRAMKILKVDEEHNTVWLNVHFTYRDVSLDEDEEFERMKVMVKDTIGELQHMNIEMVEFLRAEYCPAESGTLAWPRTELGKEATPEEFCFSESGIRVTRSCDGNFIDGARWSDVEECNVPQSSTVTEQLLDLNSKINDPSRNAGWEEQLNDICQRYDDFNSFDVYLVALIYTSCQDFDTKVFASTVDSLMKVHKKELTAAQFNMRAMDRVLNVIDKAASTGEINSTNFVTTSSTPEHLSGIVLLTNGVVTNLSGDYSLEQLLEMENIESAIWLSSELRALLDGEEVVFKLFFNDVFFTESVTIYKRISNIFGVVLPDVLHEQTPDVPIRVLHRVDDDEDANGACAHWNYNLTSPAGRGSWKNVGQSEVHSPFVLCDYYLYADTSAFALVSASDSISTSVTSDLESLMESDESASEIIDELSDISQRYSEFTSDDVYRVGRILEKVRDHNDINLESLANIVSNLHLIERSILSDSQKKKSATDMILYNVDVIINNHNYTSQVNVTAENFMIFISDLNETDFSGLVLLDHPEEFHTESLTGDVDIEEVLEYDDLDSAVVLTSGLKQQLLDGKAVVTIFLNDGMFNEEVNKSKYVSKIFGIILPDIGNYSEPIRIIHKVSAEDYSRKCVHWMFNNTNDVMGSWMSDNDGTNLSTLSQCEFWHTTHFGLILLDQDKYDSDFLDWITTINCALSMFGLICIVFTAILFKQWRMNTGNQILLNFTFAMILQICVFYGSNKVNRRSDDYLLCVIIGVVLHYSIVSQFCWMLVIAILQFKRFVEVLGGPPKCVLLKACLCGWILPCLPVACVYVFDNDTYVDGSVHLCYPSGLGLYLGVWLPIAIVVGINIVIFLFIIYSVVHRKTESGVNNNEAMFQWRLAILLFFMLGLTWTFGFLSELDFGEVFIYVFCITATLQGFVMFLFFIVFNTNTRYLYSHALKRCFNNKDY